MLEKLQNNLVIAEEHLPFQTDNNSPLQLQEIKRLQEELAKKKIDLVMLKNQQDLLLRENKILRNMQNNMAKELNSLHRQIENQATKCYHDHDVANFMEFSYSELKEATNNFDNKLKIGEGGYGGVYKGVLHSTTVAIKILRRGGNQGEREFYQEVTIYDGSTYFEPSFAFFHFLSFLCLILSCFIIQYIST